MTNGRVTAFDEAVGLGEVTSDSGETYLFHCTQIVDGTRSIAIDTEVTFTITPNRPNGPEAYAITPTP